MSGILVDRRRLAGESGMFWLRRAFTSGLLCGLIWEWFRPIVIISDVTQVYMLEPFALALFLIIAVVYAPLRLVLILLLHLLIALGLVAFYFDQTHLLDWGWWMEMRLILEQDVTHFQTLQWAAISGQTRTFLFLWLWSIATIWIYRLVIDYRFAEWFVGLTIAYLLLLEYVFAIETAQAIARVLLLGLVLLVWQRVARSIHDVQEEAQENRRLEVSAIAHLRGMPVLALVGIIVGAGWWAAGQLADSQVKEASGSPKHFGWFVSATASTSSTGYSGREQRLGGPVQPDQTMVFRAKTDILTYWKAEHRVYYTGSSWRPARGRLVAASSVNEGQIPRMTASERADNVHTIRQFIEPAPQAAEQEQILFYGGSRLVDVQGQGRSGETLDMDNLYLDQASMRYRFVDRGVPLSYTMQVVVDQESDTAADTTPEQADAKYLQVPDSLPARVEELAELITGDADDAMEKAEKLSAYLSSHYTYTMSEVNYPAEEADFVDFFLFEQLQGYCDHFSSALAMMLRTQGVPTRWVSGYSPGQIVAAPTSGQDWYEVEVRQEHAHSWVEVYSPERGWVIFDPTPAELTTMAMEQVDPPDNQLESTRPIQRQDALLPDAVAALVLLIMVTAWALFTLRLGQEGWYIWRVHRLVRHLSHAQSAEARAHILEEMWRLIYRRFEARSSGETYREYVRRLVARYPDKQLALQRFLHDFERMQYGGFHPPSGGRRALGNRWQQCFKR